jgi:hypothetical protein
VLGLDRKRSPICADLRGSAVSDARRRAWMVEELPKTT